MSDVAILPAEKGRATVLMNKEKYHSKLTQLVQSGTYRLIKRDPTKTQETKIGCVLKNIEKKGKIPTMLYNSWISILQFIKVHITIDISTIW